MVYCLCTYILTPLHYCHNCRFRLTKGKRTISSLVTLFTRATSVMLFQTTMRDWVLRNYIAARKAAFNYNTFMCWFMCTFMRSSLSLGDQWPFVLKLWHQAPQPAFDASDVMYRPGGGGLMHLM